MIFFFLRSIVSAIQIEKSFSETLVEEKLSWLPRDQLKNPSLDYIGFFRDLQMFPF